MTRVTYLKELKKHLSSLSEEEIEDTINYYSNYFEDADNDEKVIEELGNPAFLAKKILEKNKKEISAITSSSDSKNNSSDEITDGLYFEFENSDIKALQLNFGAAEVVAITGQKFSIETRGISKNAISCNLSPNGTLIVNNQRRVNLDFFNHNRKYRAVPRILISIPENTVLDALRIKIGAGSFISKNILFSTKTGSFESGAGNLFLDRIDCFQSKIRCGMGNLSINGKLSGVTEIDCGMGNVKLNILGNKDDYSFDAKVGLGDFKINDEKKSGVGQIECSEKKQNHLSVNVGMGNVSVKVGE